jgi:hypothetical protein
MARRVRQNAEQLFNKYDSLSLREHQRNQMRAAIEAADPEVIRSAEVDALVKEYADQFSVEVPALIEGAISVNVEESQVDVTGDYRFGAFDDGPTFVSGIRASYYVPFSGERELFYCSASNRNLSMRPVELGKDELIFTYDRPDQDAGATKVEFEKELAQIKETLGWLERDFRTLNTSLPGLARDTILARRARIEQMAQGVQSLGVPIRRMATVPAAQASTAEKVKREPQYDVALSFAGENRAYVEEVAEGLKAAGVSVFYDKFEKTDLWGKNLIEHLAEIYGHRSRFVVMFVSKEYVEKAWTTHERRHAQDRALLAQSEYILPARFDDTAVPGMTSTVGFVDLRHTSPSELVGLILQKLGKTSH